MIDKHTPGPWHATPAGHIASANHGFVPLLTPFRAGVHKDRFGNPTPEVLANARLIAAAPELLKALENLTRRAGQFPCTLGLGSPEVIKAADAIKDAKGDA